MREDAGANTHCEALGRPPKRMRAGGIPDRIPGGCTFVTKPASLNILAAVVLVAVAAGLTTPDSPFDEPPYPPEEALGLFEIAEGFSVELFAAEPLVADPVAMEIDERGRIYVVEDHGYPEASGAAGAVKLLRDTDGDGRPDESVVFADSLRMPRGALAWDGGLIVTDSPDLLYLKDTDGDGRADERRVLVTGFSTTNPQLGVNVPIFGLDNWIYMAHLHSGTEARLPDGTPVDVAGRNLRMKLNPIRVEALSGRSQFGHTFDAWGRHLLTINNNHIYQEAIAARYLERNPSLILSTVHESISDHGGAAEIFPVTENPDYDLFTDVGVVTSACGLTSYLGGAFGDPYDGATFVAEPVHNLVHADRLVPGGVTYTATRLAEHREFLASRDAWFRPVNFYVGPDGALYVVDYYRETVEQPKFLSDEKLDARAFYNGDDLGRIYRIVPREGLPTDWVSDLELDDASDEELAGMLGRGNVWWRRTAQRLIAERRSQAAIPALEHVFSEATSPEQKIHAMYALDALGALSDRIIERALASSTAVVRGHGILLAERDVRRFEKALLSMRHDPDARVRYQLLLTLGYLNGSEAGEARRALLRRDLDNTWMQFAALSATSIDPESEIAAAATLDPDRAGAASYMRRLGAMLAARNQAEEVVTRLSSAERRWWHAPILAGVADGLSQVEAPELDPVSAARLYVQAANADMRHAAASLLRSVGLPETDLREEVIEKAGDVLEDEDAPLAERTDAVRLLALSGRTKQLRRLLSPELPAPLQIEAVRAIGGDNAAFLLERWSAMTPSVRNVASEVLAGDSSGVVLLLDAVERGSVRPRAIPWGIRKRTMLHPNVDIAARAKDLLPERTSPDEITDSYRPALERQGDPDAGRAVFERACAVCHQMGGKGGLAFGPDLSTVRSRQPESLLIDILQPNREIVSGYEQWVVRLRDGTMMTGVIPNETPTSITIRMPGGTERTVARSAIESMEATGVSAMPVGLESQISVDDMADLLAFLRR